MSSRSRAGLLLAHAAVTFLCFPHPLGGGEIDLGAGLAWLSPALLLLAVWGLSPGRAAGLGFAAALVGHGAILHWIYVVTVHYGGAPVVVGLIAPLLLGLYTALATAAFCAAWSLWLRRLPWPLFGAAALWVVVEHARHFVLTGFPWALIGYAQHRNPAMLGLAPLTGVLGLSFVTVLGSSLLAVLLRREPARIRGLEARVALGMVVAALLIGVVSWRTTDADAGPRVGIGVVQGNVRQDQKWSPGRVSETLESYAELTRGAVAKGAQIVVWPETAVAAPAEAMEPILARIQALARETGAVLVVGTVGIDEPERFDPAPPRLYDSALVVSPEGVLLDRYDKTRLVPFGEYLPLRALLGRFIRAIATGSAGRDVTPGDRVRRVELPVPASSGTVVPASSGTVVPAGVPICYELVFPDLVRRFVDDGGGVLLGITNDAWYGRTGAPLQFLAMTAMRSAENGVWTARAANTGVSAFIDSRGQVRDRTGLFERGFLVSEVPVLQRDAKRTVYTRHGDWIVVACWLLIAGVGLGSLWRQRVHTASGPGPAQANEETDER